MTIARVPAAVRTRRTALPVVLVLGLVGLWTQVVLGGPLARLDLALRAWVHQRGDGIVVQVAHAVADVANPATSVALLLAVGAAVSAARRTWPPAVLALTAAVLLSVAVLGLKHVVGRVGPRGDSTLAWPSGHTTTAVVVAGVLLCLLPRSWRRVGALVAAGYAAVVGVAMVLCTYHWAGDVLAAWLLGPLVLLAARGATRRLTGPAAGRGAPAGRVGQGRGSHP
ncbi:hypothetical protein GCM10027047_34210 [Rhodococcus aerolatus]